MITAQQAKQFYDDSGYEVEQFLRHSVETPVINAAKGGKREVMIHLGAVGPFEYVDQVVTPLNKAVVEKLQTLGYRSKIVKYGESYVPRGLADDDGKGPSHTNYGIQISW